MFGLLTRLLTAKILGDATHQVKDILEQFEATTKKVVATVLIAQISGIFLLIGCLFFLMALFVHLASFRALTEPALWTGGASIGFALVLLLFTKAFGMNNGR